MDDKNFSFFVVESFAVSHDLARFHGISQANCVHRYGSREKPAVVVRWLD
jgi:hypothetical protein